MNDGAGTDDRHTGTVQWYDPDRGAGEVRPDDGGAPCSFRSATLRECGIDALSAGDRVRFELDDAGRQRMISNLTLLRAVDRWENEGGATDPGTADPDSP